MLAAKLCNDVGRDFAQCGSPGVVEAVGYVAGERDRDGFESWRASRSQLIDGRPNDRRSLTGAAARDSVPDRLNGRAMLKGQRQAGS